MLILLGPLLLWVAGYAFVVASTAHASSPPAVMADSTRKASRSIAASSPPGADDLTGYPSISTLPAWAPDFSGVVNGVYTDKPVVALTFDDGPTPRTRWIVDQLDGAGSHATFFWVGSRIATAAAAYAIAHGEELGNHTWTHPDMHRLTSEEASEQIGWTSERIAQLTGSTPTWFRSPFNHVYVDELGQIQAHGLIYANYNVTSVDWMKGVTVKGILWKIDQGLAPGGVILMHDSPDHDPVYLPQLLTLLHRRGYRAVTLTTLAQMGPLATSAISLDSNGQLTF